MTGMRKACAMPVKECPAACASAVACASPARQVRGATGVSPSRRPPAPGVIGAARNRAKPRCLLGVHLRVLAVSVETVKIVNDRG